MQTPEQFLTSKQQLARYAYAKELYNIARKYQKLGYLILDEDNQAVTGEFTLRTEFNEDDWDVVSIEKPGFNLILIQIEYKENGDPWLPPKHEIKKAFSGFTIINPQNLIKLI